MGFVRRLRQTFDARCVSMKSHFLEQLMCSRTNYRNKLFRRRFRTPWPHTRFERYISDYFILYFSMLSGFLTWMSCLVPLMNRSKNLGVYCSKPIYGEQLVSKFSHHSVGVLRIPQRPQICLVFCLLSQSPKCRFLGRAKANRLFGGNTQANYSQLQMTFVSPTNTGVALS